MSYKIQTFSCYNFCYGTLFLGYTIVVSTGAALRSSEVYPFVMAFGRVFPNPEFYARFRVSNALPKHKGSGKTPAVKRVPRSGNMSCSANVV